MRRSLTRATAVLVACTLALSLGGADSGVPGKRASATTGAASAAPGESGGPARAARALTPGGAEGGRTEVGTSLWTHVDRAFPDLPHDGGETATVGTGSLVWDRAYTRRALFRFPVALDPDAVVDSAVLRAEVAWSYDCHSDSSVQVHRVDPFHAGTTWNDQPRTRALLDTQRVMGGRAACPVSGGVEFDVTEAYQRAVDNGESHIDVRLGERDESGTAAWLRFDVGNEPPVLAVDQSAPQAPGADADPTAVTGGPRYGAQASPPLTSTADTAFSGATASEGTDREGVFPVSTAPEVLSVSDIRVQLPSSGDRLRAGMGRATALRRQRAERPSASHAHRRRAGAVDLQARGPPLRAPVGERTLLPRPLGHG